MYLGTCSDCSAPFLARTGKAGLCSSCRLAARLDYVGRDRRSKRRCSTCGDSFAPSHTNDNIACGPCAASRAEEFTKLKCGLCGTPGPPVYPDVALCLTCLKDPAGRKALLRAVKVGKQRRVAQFHGNEDAQSDERAELARRMPGLALEWAKVTAAEHLAREKRVKKGEYVSRSEAKRSLEDQEIITEPAL